MKFRSVLPALLSPTLLVTLAVAQDPPAAPPPPVFQVTTLELSPATMAAWRDARAKMAEAAKAANLPVAEFGWWDYNNGNRTVIVTPRNRADILQGANARARILAVNPAADTALTAAFEGIQVTLVSQELIVAQPNRTYEPATVPAPGGVAILNIRIAPGQGQAFTEAVQAMNKVRADIKYPYPMRSFGVRFGESRTVLATFFDNREAYYGKNQMGRLLEGNAAAMAEWQAAVQKFNAATADITPEVATYSTRQSYAP